MNFLRKNRFFTFSFRDFWGTTVFRCALQNGVVIFQKFLKAAFKHVEKIVKKCFDFSTTFLTCLNAPWGKKFRFSLQYTDLFKNHENIFKIKSIMWLATFKKSIWKSFFSISLYIHLDHPVHLPYLASSRRTGQMGCLGFPRTLNPALIISFRKWETFFWRFLVKLLSDINISNT